ncbi:MAG: hypothetical protein RLZZ64_430 [Bacteroidota bacterium]|jgi:hypothetical protein
MYIIKNKNEQVVAVIQNNIVFTPQDHLVVGILIGDCLYGKSFKMVGKIFNSTVYLLNGSIAGTVEANNAHNVRVIKKEHMVEAWAILSGVKEHTSQWIIEKKSWAQKGLIDYLG